MEDLQSALPYAERALSLAEKRGAGSQNTVIAMLHLASLHARMGNFDQAMPTFRRAWKFAAENPRLFEAGYHATTDLVFQQAAVLASFAELLQRMGLEEEAREMESRVKALDQEAETSAN
jgi:tetratricopeptide (TPR) repeat protein